MLALIATTAAVPLIATAQDYPKPGATIRYVVPFPPGGLTDVMARQVGQQLAERWKVNVVIDNKPGSGGQIGAAEVAKAPPDGQTLLAITMTHAANATLYKGKAPFDFMKDLKPVALLAGSPMLIVVPAASPIKDFADLIAQAKARKLNAGSSGNGKPPHLTLALFNDLFKTEIQHVPYTGSAEAGAPQLAVENWTAIMAPGGTPDAVVAKLGAEVVQIMAMPDLEERAKTQGFRVDARPAATFAPFLAGEVERWGRIITAARIQTE